MELVHKAFLKLRGGNAQPLAVFGHGAAGAFDALLFEHFGQLVVAERLDWALGADKLFDQGPHRRARRVATRLGAQAGAKEILELKGAKRCRHVFGGGHAADGGLVQAELFGNLAQHQRAHGEFAVHEEALLPLDDGELTRRMVSKRCWMFLMNQRASCRRCCSAAYWQRHCRRPCAV